MVGAGVGVDVADGLAMPNTTMAINAIADGGTDPTRSYWVGPARLLTG